MTVSLFFLVLCCGASRSLGGKGIASQDLKQIVAVHDTTKNPFIVPSIGGRIGDPFPSYWDGVWHVYTLRKDLDVVLHFTSTDLVVWNEHKPAMVGRGIATGTVVRHDNKYYLFYTDAEPQTIRLVTSDNLWSFDFASSVLIAEADHKVYTLEKEKFRDCYVFYYEKETLWWMLVEATSQGNVAVGLFKSKDLLNWIQHDPIFMDSVRGHGSCPQLIEKGGRWYLPMLDYPTWYYVANDPYGPWKLGGFYHSKRMSAASRWDTDSKRWLGWGFFTTDDTPEGDLDWEGYGPMCVGRELVFNKEGSLGVRPIPELVEAIRESEGHAYLYACTKIRSGTWVIDPGKKQLRSTDDQGGVLMFDLPEKNSNYYFETDVELSTPQTKVDIVVRASKGFDNGYRIAVEPDKKVAAIRHFTSYDGVFDEMAHVPDEGISFRVKAFVYEGIIEVFVDGRTALSTRVVDCPNYRVAIDVSGGEATIRNPLLHYFKVNASQIDSTRDGDNQHGYQGNDEDKPSDQNDTADSRSHSATILGSSGGGTVGGRVPMSWVFFSPRNKESEINVFTEKGSVTLESLDVYRLNSIWDGGRDEFYRPQFHYSPKTGVMGDPHGLVYYDGEYHLFYQWEGPWGHAVSTDMIHWQQLTEALTPDAHAGGHSVYSGSCVVDYNNTAGFKTGENDVIIAIYTINNDGMESQALAYSNDRGRTFTAYAGNPVMATEYDKRDPKVFWYESDSKWVMALHNKFGVDFYSSPNLKDWTYMSRIEGFNECPDIFELPVDGDPKNTKWILLDASNTGYRLGQFDGTAFIPETAGMPIDFGRNHYATQTFSNIPRSDGRTIQMAWMKSAHYPGMPFDQQQTFPSELSLRTYADGVRLCRAPIREIESIRGKHYKWSNEILVDGDEQLLSGINHDLIEIIAVFDLTDATSPEFGFHLRDAVIYYYVAASQLTAWHDNISKKATLKPKNNRISMHILLDRASFEVYAN